MNHEISWQKVTGNKLKGRSIRGNSGVKYLFYFQSIKESTLEI